METNHMGSLHSVRIRANCPQVCLYGSRDQVWFIRGEELQPLLFRWELGNQVVQCLSSKVGTFLDYTYQGAGFVFSYLATGKPFLPDVYNNTDSDLTDTVRTVLEEINDQGVVPLPFFFGPLSIVYFVSFFVSMLYYWGTLQFIVKKIGTQYTE